MYGTYLHFRQENLIRRSFLRSVRILQSIPNSLLIISSIMLSCQEPDSNPYLFGSLSNHFRTVLKMELGSLPRLPMRLLLNRPFNPRLPIRTSQSRTVEYAVPSSLQIFHAVTILSGAARQQPELCRWVPLALNRLGQLPRAYIGHEPVSGLERLAPMP